MKKVHGVVSAGHQATADAAKEILLEGGNAYDAIIASYFMSCLAEPVLSSLGGGGALLAHTADGKNRVYDFFVQTPKKRNIGKQPDFFPIDADFGGGVIQTFHIGMGSVAVPGAVAGALRVHKDMGKLPLARVIEPATRAARQGIEVSEYQSSIFDIVSAIYLSKRETRALFESNQEPGKLLRAGELEKMSHYADTLELLAREGRDAFYVGDIAKKIVRDMSEKGGYITQEDLREYKVEVRDPLEVSYRGRKFYTNPPPSSGGILIAFALKLLEKHDVSSHDSKTHQYMTLLSEVMDLTNHARKEEKLAEKIFHREEAEKLLDKALLDQYRREVATRINRLGSTTHMSVIDSEGNMASMTVTNGEGCGYIIPETDIMLNNMLGEEDLHPDGFHLWEEDARISTMMAPSLLVEEGGLHVALGSGGSNRIRTAILQVLLNMIDHRMSIQEAVTESRVHFEKGILSVEGGGSSREAEELKNFFPNVKVWDKKSLFFGGVHAACFDEKTGEYSGAGDPRRDGVSKIVKD